MVNSNIALVIFVVVQLLNCVQFFETTQTATHQSFLSFTNSWSLFQLMFIESVMPYNHLIICCPLLLLCSVFPSIRVFSSESALYITWTKYQSFSFTTSSSSEYSGLISFRIDWFDFLAIQGTLKSLLQHHNLKASVLQHSAFFVIQHSNLYMTIGTTITLNIWIFVAKVMSLFNMLSRIVIAFLPRSKHLLILELQSPSSVILEPKNRRSVTVSTLSSSICHVVVGPDAMVLVFEC